MNKEKEVNKLSKYTQAYVKEHQKAKIRNTRVYLKVVEHRSLCPKWKNGEICKDCFGGGLVNFVRNLILEITSEEP